VVDHAVRADQGTFHAGPTDVHGDHYVVVHGFYLSLRRN
jgi:hypothetical protein